MPEIRPFTLSDAAVTLRVFERAVRVTGRAAYTAAQVEAWAGPPRDVEAWGRARAAARTFVAIRDETIVGFVDVDERGEVDMLFVDPDAGRAGIAGRLIAHIVALAEREGLAELTTHASELARPVFARAGFRVVDTESVERGGESLTRHHMRRAIGAPAPRG